MHDEDKHIIMFNPRLMRCPAVALHGHSCLTDLLSADILKLLPAALM